MAGLIPWRSRGLERWDPFREFESIQEQMNRLFSSAFGRGGLLAEEEGQAGAWAPTVDVVDAKDRLRIKAELPGLKKDDIQVSVEDSSVVISGEKKEEKEQKEEGFIRRESTYGSFYRSIPLPSGADPNKIDASYKDGVLELTIPKSEQAKPKQITVK